MTRKEKNLRQPRRNVLPQVRTLAAVNPREIEVHIEELVLDGFTAFDRQHISDTVSTELGGLLAAQGIPTIWKGNVEKLIAEPTSNRLTNPATVGAQIANAIYHSHQPKRGNSLHSRRGVERL